MGKNNKKKKGNQYAAEDRKPYGGQRRDYDRGEQKNFNGYDKPQQKDVTYGPIAKLLYEEMQYQIETYLAAYEAEPKEAAKDLFKIDSYPAVFTTPDGIADQYDVYQLERNVRPMKSNPNILQAPSASILVLDRETGKPAFFIKAFLMTRDDKYTGARVTVFEYDDRGNDYRKSLRAKYDMENWTTN